MSEIPVTVPFVSFRPMERELDAELRGAFARVLDNSWYIGGREDAAFEKAFAAYCGVRHCIGCGNGLDALVLILKAMGIGPGDEVIAPSNTFIATVLAISYAGATPVLVEPTLASYNIDPARIEAAVTPRTKAIMAVHLYGQCAPMDEINAIAKNMASRSLRMRHRPTAQSTRAAGRAASAMPPGSASTRARIWGRWAMQAA